jgi:hypothetical protein
MKIMKIIIILLTLFTLSCPLFLVARCAKENKIPAKYAKYKIWLGTATFSTAQCADEYQISENAFITFYQLPDGIKTTIPLFGVKEIEEKPCKYKIK